MNNNISKKDDKLLLELDNETIVLSSTKIKYKIHDIERVIPFDLDILKEDSQQVDTQVTSDIIRDLDISLEEIKEKDIVYTDTELKERLLAELIYIYDAYDNHGKIEELTLFVDEYSMLPQKVLYYIDQRSKQIKENTVYSWACCSKTVVCVFLLYV